MSHLKGSNEISHQRTKKPEAPQRVWVAACQKRGEERRWWLQWLSKALMSVRVKSTPQAGSPMAGEAGLAWQPGRSCEITFSCDARADCPQRLPFGRSGEALWGCCLRVEEVQRQGCSGWSGSPRQRMSSLSLTSQSWAVFPMHLTLQRGKEAGEVEKTKILLS